MAHVVTGAPYVVQKADVRYRLLILFTTVFVPGPPANLVRLIARPGPPPPVKRRHSIVPKIRFLLEEATIPTPVVVPDVIGLAESNAIFALTSIGLIPQVTFVVVAGGSPDTVVSQSPLAGVSVSVGTTVLLSVVAYLVTPNVVGLPQATALTQLSGFLVTLSTATSTTVPTGDVISQSVAPGTVVAQGSASIALVISTGAGFQGFTLGQALQILSNDGFVVNPVFNYQYSSTVPWNYVIGQLPAAGTQQQYQSQGVQLTVSMGPPNPSVTTNVPNVVGKSLIDAIAKIVDAKLNVQAVHWVIGNQPIASVTAQTPAGGTNKQLYTGVTLTVCSGPAQTNIINTTQTVPLVH